ncbi:MAG: endonuclease [Bacteroidales bacterium]
MKKGFLLLLSIFWALGLCAQIPNGYYNEAKGLKGDKLKSALHNIIKDHKTYSYDALRDYLLSESDEDPDNSDNVILIYTGKSIPKTDFNAGKDGWNREHVWAKSHGDFGTGRPAGTDAHHIRPCDVTVNSSRGNKDFDMGGEPHKEAKGCFTDRDSWEPRDEVKGDVARMIMYMAVRYEGEKNEPDLEMSETVGHGKAPLHGVKSVLLEWNRLDPPSDFEKNRNEVVYSYQKNRNPFIDHPEYADLIWTVDVSLDESENLKPAFTFNTTNKTFSVDLSAVSDNDVDAQIFDMNGVAIEAVKMKSGQQNTFSLVSYQKGVYILRLNVENKFFAYKLVL